ncbi:MAG: hypothetical protein J0L64_08365 [Acidobacteria bacterium]|nr:hypothetical protein [Acidobacteriota bacterium]
MAIKLPAALVAAALAWTATEASAQIVMNQPVNLVAFLPTAPPTILTTVGPGLFRATNSNFQLLAGEFQTIYFRQPGTPQPQITKFLYSPAAPQIVYATTDTADGGVWKSVDAGLTWAVANKGLPTAAGLVVGLQFLPGNTATLYCAVERDIYQSTDSGANWAKVSTLPAVANQFLISPHDTKLWVASDENQMRRSIDGGQNWLTSATVSLGTGTVITGMVADVNNPALITVTAAGTGRGFGVYQVDVVNPPGNAIVLRHTAQAFQILYPSAESKLPIVSTLGAGGASCYDIPVDQGMTRWVRGCINVNSIGPPFLAINPANIAQTFAGTSTGLYKSENGLGPWNTSYGTVRPTLAVPNGAYEFKLEAGRTGSLALALRSVEFQTWVLPLDVTTTGGSWLTVSNVTGSTPANATVSVSAAGLAAGNYEGTVTVRSSLAGNSPLLIPVKLTVTAPVADPGYIIQTIAGTGAPANTGEDGPAAQATLSSPDSVLVESDGSVIVVDSGNHAVKAVRPDGRLRRVAGTGLPGVSGDGGDPMLASFRGPRGITAAPGGYYITDAGNRRVRRILGSTLTTYLSGPENLRGIAVSPSGTVYLALATDHVVIAVEGDVAQSRVVAGRIGVSGFRGDGGPATGALLSSPSELFLDAKGDLYIADTDNHRIRVISAADKTIRTVAGSGLGGFQSETGNALAVALNKPTGVALDAAGSLVIADSGNHRIRMVAADGQMRTIAGTGEPGFAGEGTAAALALLRSPSDVAVAANGRIFFSDTQNHRVRALTPRSSSLPAISDGGVVSAADGRVTLAPGGLFSVYGANLATGTATASEVPWPTSLRGVQVAMNGQPVPVYFVSPGQINGQAPFALGPGEVDVTVTIDGVTSSPRKAVVQSAAPGVLQYGVNRAVVQNSNGSVNASNNPARAGEAITIYLTGIGALDNAVATGAAAPGDPLSRASAPARITVGGVDAQVLFVGLTPGFVGLAQANIVVPQLGAGEYPLEITIGGVASNRPVITVRN